ncbi:MAG TPA: YceI family protein [Candidatus Binatia bacterium]|nr:YceI family protein [Candidatus Binatia bacterium]
MIRTRGSFPQRLTIVFLVLFAALTCARAAAQNPAFQLDPQHTSVKFTLGDVLHTVHGTFRLQSGTLRLDAASGKLEGRIVVDARSGDSGNSMRDRKMQREVLESDRYPEIAFRPDQVQGTVAMQGKSTVQVHGIFTIHGVDREITIPAEVEIAGGNWNATLHFTVPYVKWGMKNPSTMFLRVNESVEIEISAAGTLQTQ